MLSVLNVDFLLFGASDPVGEFKVVGNRRRKHYYADGVWQLHNDLLPDTAALFIVNVVDLIEDDPFNVLDLAAVVVKHRLEDFGCHDQTGCVLIELDIASDDANIPKLQLEVPVFLVTQGLNRRGVNRLGHVSSGKRDGILRDHCLTRRGMGCNHNTVTLLQPVDGALLKVIKLEAELEGGELHELVKVLYADIVRDHPVLLGFVS